MTANADRAFSEAKHGRHEWSTRRPAPSNRTVRWFVDYFSFKRAGVSQLARAGSVATRVLDMGCGTGAYSAWYAAACPATLIACDWSVAALRTIAPPRRGKVLRVCADAHALPFRSEVFAQALSVDALGHFNRPDAVLDELLRVVEPEARLFMHSECSDPQRRWPDRALIARLGRDMLSEAEGHVGLRTSTEVRSSYVKRFEIISFVSPAGLLGWLTGYPEKYAPAFDKAGWRVAGLIAHVMAIVKAAPLLGWALRLFNATTNHLEAFLGIEGGGSCFAFLRKPARGASGA